ncbi:hypothetical protein B9Z19DRAFT_1069737 [Tuber borchii]|uniref:Uncharacterized protein n=1 Tax=Tuber borchii TaxID=42251 RepID=A0A2T6ZAM4_TUBBO|nr:hypothetical protein B9Z19DRAFT_1069737 [Tuber borchii]
MFTFLSYRHATSLLHFRRNPFAFTDTNIPFPIDSNIQSFGAMTTEQDTVSFVPPSDRSAYRNIFICNFHHRGTVLGGLRVAEAFSQSLTRFGGNNGETFIERLGRLSTHPWISAILVVWNVIIKAIFLQTIDGDLLKLVYHLSRFRMLPSVEPLMWLKPKPKLMLFPTLPPSFSLLPSFTPPLSLTPTVVESPAANSTTTIPVSPDSPGTDASRIRRAPKAQGQRVGFQLETREARKAICEIEGLDDKDLDTIYKGPASSAIMVQSEMGEPIYKSGSNAFGSQLDVKIAQMGLLSDCCRMDSMTYDGKIENKEAYCSDNKPKISPEPPPLSPSSAGMKGRVDAFQPTNRLCPSKKSYNLNAPSTNAKHSIVNLLRELVCRQTKLAISSWSPFISIIEKLIIWASSTSMKILPGPEIDPLTGMAQLVPAGFLCRHPYCGNHPTFDVADAMWRMRRALELDLAMSKECGVDAVFQYWHDKNIYFKRVL